MIFTQHYLACLSQASSLIGDEATGRAVVVDPRRDVDVYLDEAHARSSIATSMLVAAGFADVSDLRGGFAAWESACAR